MHARALVLVALLLLAPLSAQALTQRSTNPIPAPTAGIYSLACTIVFEEAGSEYCDHAGYARAANALQVRIAGAGSAFVWVEQVLPEGNLPILAKSCSKDCQFALPFSVTGNMNVEATFTGAPGSVVRWSIGQSFGNLLA